MNTEQVASIPAIREPAPVIPFNPNEGALAVVARMVSSGVAKEAIDQMVKLIEWDDARKARMEFNAAFALAKGKFKQAKKSGNNLHLKSKYSLLEDYDDATRDALTEHGLSWRHVPRMEGNNLHVRCILAHQSGHTEESELFADAHSMINNAVNKLQSEGIVLMYLKRMTLSSMLGIVSDSEFDNDGNGGKPSEKITQDQVEKLKAKIAEVGASPNKFLSLYKIETVEDLPASKYQNAMAELDQYGKRKQAEKK